MKGIEDRVALVTGAGSGIGRATALRFAEEGARVAVADVVESFGGLHVAHNNAGIEGTPGNVVDQTVEEFDRVIGVNLRGVFVGMKFEIPELLEAGGGAIVNTSSIAGLVGGAGLTPYYASKHGVVGLTRSVALEYADQGIRVNAVCPGVIDTPMIERFTGGDEEAKEGLVATEPIGRMADPSEVAAAVVWLCSDEASYVTGFPMAVDGGLIAQ
jgi:NAD(P)-dependent dehydrogenase (short-subunit alcohol dehydrogenase family)